MKSKLTTRLEITHAYYLHVCILILVISCQKNIEGGDEIDLSLIQYDVLDLSEINKDDPTNLLFPSDYTATRLSKKDIKECELILKKQIDVFNEKSAKKIDLEKYGRQYVGARTPAGDIVVYLNCFCDPKRFTERDRDLVQVFDGGICYFQLKIDLARNKIFDFRTNGVA